MERLEEQHLFLNTYICEHCKVTWGDVWTCTCNDRCPVCNAEMEPVFSEDYNTEMEPLYGDNYNIDYDHNIET